MTRGPGADPVAGDSLSASPMRSLTVRPPWSWAIMHGGKDVENRTWSTDLGTIAVHAGLRADPDAVYSPALQESWTRLLPLGPYGVPGWHNHPVLERGSIIGTVDIVSIHFADWQRGCYVEADVLGWVPLDGSDASEEGWAPSFCSRWGHVPIEPHLKGDGRQRHWVLANPRPLVYPIPFTGHLGLRPLDPRIAAQVTARLDGQRDTGQTG